MRSKRGETDRNSDEVGGSAKKRGRGGTRPEPGEGATTIASVGPQPRRHVPPAAGRSSSIGRERNPVRRFLMILGPGLITGAADDDPSGIATYSVAGASLGFAALWLAPLSLVLATGVQYTCAKIALVSGRGLAGVLRQYYPRWLLYPAVTGLLIANTINAGTDIGAIAAALGLFIPIPPSWMVAPIALLMVALLVLGSYRIVARTFKWLTLALFAYMGAAILSNPDWTAVVRGSLLPSISLNSTFLSTMVAILGTTISPYLFFWQASQEVEEEESIGRKRLWQRKGATDTELRYAAWDVGIGMFFSELIMYVIILATGATLFTAGVTDIGSAADAAVALRPLAGEAAYALFALGIVGAGFLGAPILAGSAAYAVAEVFHWQAGLNQRPTRAKQFYAVIVASTVVGIAIDFLGINPITALFWTAVINGFVAPPLLAIIMLVSNNRKVMGRRANGRLTNLVGWATTLAMFAAAIGLVVTWRAG